MNELSVEQVPEPRMRNDQDMIVRLIAGTTCGSDLHLIGGYIPAVQAGDVTGHEFIGEVVESGPEVRRHRVGDRVMVCSFVGGGRCWYRAHDLWSLCDNANTNPGIGQALFGYEAAGGVFGYSHAMGGLRGSHAEHVRVPFADYGAFTVREGVDDTSALFVPDSVPNGWTGAHLGGVQPGDTVAVRGCGAVGQMAARAAIPLGAERVISIDPVPERLSMTERFVGSKTLDYGSTDIAAELRERTGGRGPDVCVEAVGMEAHRNGPAHLYGQVEQRLRLQTDRPTAVRQAIHACRKAGTVFVLGVSTGAVDTFPPRRSRQQGPHRARRADARPAPHSHAPGARGRRRPPDLAAGHAHDVLGRSAAGLRHVQAQDGRMRTRRHPTRDVAPSPGPSRREGEPS
ncbi:alcohol dehydrogenase catalytic domain-containing protein [Streptomyces sp. NPDC058664]|uniref:alcohol dehydrogenase catalytic domain-containing protein n=1 Tax=unclassified Streptomyces TaxID=2593676 RepID=UPI0036542F6D